MTDRNPSKQRRAAQNKAARQALANRTTKASQPSSPSSSNGKDAPAARGGRSQGGRSQGTARTGQGRPARGAARPTGKDGRPARTGGAVVRQPTNPLSKLLADVQAVPGGKGIFFAFLFSIVAAVMLMVAKITPQTVMFEVGRIISAHRSAHHLAVPDGINAKTGQPSKAVISTDYALAILGPLAVVFAVVPILITSVGMALALRENRRRNFTVLALVMVMFVLLTSSLSPFFLFSAGGLVYAAFKARQAEPPPLRAGRSRRTGSDGDDASDGDVDADGFEDVEDDDEA